MKGSGVARPRASATLDQTYAIKKVSERGPRGLSEAAIAFAVIESFATHSYDSSCSREERAWFDLGCTAYILAFLFKGISLSTSR